jgi:protein-S-isoprenylcysteine O-methyltransferase Ste14
MLSWLFPYLVVAGFVMLIDRILIRVEEKMLADQFGVHKEAYEKQTRRSI